MLSYYQDHFILDCSTLCFSWIDTLFVQTKTYSDDISFQIRDYGTQKAIKNLQNAKDFWRRKHPRHSRLSNSRDDKENY